jgi:pyrimidine-nucleoside phosphorylase
MLAQEVIAKKRDGGELTGEEIEGFIAGYVRGEMPDYQAAAFLMATYLRGMTDAETAALTRAMAYSGDTLDLAAGGIPADAPTIDKHSTGGVGDKTSLIVVPLLAAAGAFVCKMSGRGLGHTGGTLDKLESIPGFRIGLSPEEMVRQVRKIGGCLAGQTDTLAPADKKLYALRDATATVGCLPLIVSSILSKKIAGGAKSFLFDVKIGGGALVANHEEARALATALVAGARLNGRNAVAILSDMDSPLGNAVGNALEIEEAIRLLSPRVPVAEKAPRLREVCLSLTSEALLLCGIRDSRESARTFAESLLDSGAGLNKLREIIVAQGGDGTVIESPESVLPRAPHRLPLLSETGGFLQAVPARPVGEAVVRLGGGRKRKEDAVDPAVGVVFVKFVGDAVHPGEVIGVVHARTEESGKEAIRELNTHIRVGSAPPLPSPLIHDLASWEKNM